MILIVTDSGLSRSVEDVIDWIEYLGGSWKRINGINNLLLEQKVKLELANTNYFLQIEDNVLNNCEVIWFRGIIRYRGFTKKIISGISSTNDNVSELKIRIIQEMGRFINLFTSSIIKNKLQLPNITSAHVNKLHVLRVAQSVGLFVPNSIITNNKKDLMNFYYKNNEQVITKPLYENIFFEEDKQVFFYNNHMISTILDSLPNTFFPSLFQEYVNKEYELRIFFLDGNFYTMAIFSQLDEKTRVDFRNYNEGKPNRTIPYLLPSNIEDLLRVLMEKLNLNTGSIDVIKSIQGHYYFLEVNPVGQFGMTSHPCNYFLEKEIANFLIKNDR